MSLALFVLAYGVPGTVGGALAIADNGGLEAMRAQSPWPPLVFLTAYLLGGYLLLVYVVFGAHRFRFRADGFDVFTWRGWQTFAWTDVRRAAISTYRGNVELALFVGARRRVGVLLSAFERPYDALHAIAARLPVPVPATAAQLEQIRGG